MNGAALKSNGTGTGKVRFHHTEIHPAENGGIIIEHHHTRDDHGYPSSVDSEKHAFGEDEHADAMKEAHSKVCSSGGCTAGSMGAKAAKAPRAKEEKSMMHGVREKVGKTIATLGKKQGVGSPTKN